MAQDLPDDVWIQIVESQRWFRRTLHNLSLTSRRMHLLVVPVLFRDVKFDINDALAGLQSVMVGLIRAIMRARFLFNSPKLLRHTRSFSFFEYFNAADDIAEYLVRHERSDSSSSRGDAKNLLAVLHDTIYRLIFRMPGLREVHIGDIVITPLCFAAISSRRLLTALRLETRRPSGITHEINLALPYQLQLRDFVYHHTRTGNDRRTDPDILDHFISGLKDLSISSILLPFVVSHIKSHRTLSLRNLEVGFPDDPEPSSSLAVAAFLQLLCVCPQLRKLNLTGHIPVVEPAHYPPPPSLPNLSTFSGTSCIFQILSAGMNLANLARIDIHDHFDINEKSLTQIMLSPPTNLYRLCLWQVAFSTQTPHEFLTFIRSLAVFQNLETLQIEYETDISWKDHVSVQDSHSTIKDLVDQLTRLRYLDIRCWCGSVKGYDIGCPISKQGEPADRGHPSLEWIGVDFICGMWIWSSQTGWRVGGFL